MNRSKLFIINELKERKYSFLESTILQAKGSEYEVPFAVEPTKGEHSLESCEGCRKQWSALVQEIDKKFEKFPNCCARHKNLNNKDFFNKDDYNGIAEQIANKVMYSYHHIINNLENEDWYNDIINYLKYNVESFGKMPLDCGEPFQLSNYYHYLLNILKNIEKEISSDKISIIEVKTRMNKIKRLIDINNKPLVDENKTDLNLLLTKYDEWYKAFPFDLPYFKHLEPKFRKLIPLHTGRTNYNKYLKTTEHEPHTKESLTVFLLQTTQSILTSINGVTLYEKGLLNDAEKIAIDLLMQNRKLELLELSAMPNTKKADYIKVLKKWFKQEKKFIKDITPILKTQQPQNNKGFFLNNDIKEPQLEDKELLNTFCKSMPLSIPKEHFKILTIEKSKNKKPFLNEEEFNRFIKRAFLGHNQLKKIKFNQAPKGEKLKLQYLFREFYEKNHFEYEISQDNFIKLLTDNFIGWNFKNVKDNFKTKPNNIL